MTLDSAKARFLAMNPVQKAALLAKFGHNMTIAARETYVPDSTAVHSPERLRSTNELLHRVLGHINALLSQSEFKYPDETMVEIMLNHGDDHLNAQAAWSFEQANLSVPK